MIEREKAAKYLGTDERGASRTNKKHSLRKWSSRVRSSPTRGMEGRRSRSERYQSTQGSSNGSSHKRGS